MSPKINDHDFHDSFRGRREGNERENLSLEERDSDLFG